MAPGSGSSEWSKSESINQSDSCSVPTTGLCTPYFISGSGIPHRNGDLKAHAFYDLKQK